MTKQRSKLFVGVGVLCFVGAMALWLGVSGDRAIADAERAPLVAKTLTQAVDGPTVFNGPLESAVSFKDNAGLVQRLSVQVSIATEQAKNLKVYLTSPSGTKVLLVDGARSKAVTKDGLKGWFGADGLQTAESLAAFAGEPVGGQWRLRLEGNATGRVTKWSLTTDVGPNTLLAGAETYGEYTSDGGCDCRVGSGNEMTGGLLTGLFLLGLVAIRRRK